MYDGNKLEQTKQKLRNELLSFDRIRKMSGKENLTQKEYEEMVSFIETLAEVMISNYLRNPTAFSNNETNPK